jgi:ribosomal protein L7/L12
MTLGLAELVIMGAVMVAIFIFLGMFLGAKRNTQTAAVEPLFKSKLDSEIDWDAIADPELQSYLQPNTKIQAIKRYRDLTDAGLKEAKDAIEYVMENPDGMKKGKSSGVVDTDAAGVRDLIAEGRIDEAVKVYAAFMGVDEFTARNAIEKMQREDGAETRLSTESMDEVRTLLDAGNKIEAIKAYREMTGLGLKEAKDEVERMERDKF